VNIDLKGVYLFSFFGYNLKGVYRSTQTARIDGLKKKYMDR